MSDLVVVALVLVALAGAAWLIGDARTVPRGRGHRPEAAHVSVVLPARDEEAGLPAVLNALGRLTVGVREVVVVDDASQDRTAEVARAGGAVVVPAGEPPAGWTGKAWACHVGAQTADGDLLLFLDADTVLAPDALGGLLELHGPLEGHPGLVSVQPHHLVEKPHEQLSAYFNAVSVLASGAFRRRPRGAPMAFGPCLLTTRADYERAGGHGAVRAAVLDDVELAVAYARVGLPVLCLLGGASVRMRSYPGGLRELVGGWTKNMASGASAAATGPTLGAVAWVSAHHAVAAGAVTAVVALVVGHDPGTWGGWGPVALWAGAWVAVAVQLRWLLHRLGSFAWWTWAVFPVGLLVFDVVFARSLVATAVRRSVTWRGRTVDLRRSGRDATEKEA